MVAVLGEGELLCGANRGSRGTRERKRSANQLRKTKKPKERLRAAGRAHTFPADYRCAPARASPRPCQAHRRRPLGRTGEPSAVCRDRVRCTDPASPTSASTTAAKPSTGTWMSPRSVTVHRLGSSSLCWRRMLTGGHSTANAWPIATGDSGPAWPSVAAAASRRSRWVMGRRTKGLVGDARSSTGGATGKVGRPGADRPGGDRPARRERGAEDLSPPHRGGVGGLRRGERRRRWRAELAGAVVLLLVLAKVAEAVLVLGPRPVVDVGHTDAPRRRPRRCVLAVVAVVADRVLGVAAARGSPRRYSEVPWHADAPPRGRRRRVLSVVAAVADQFSGGGGGCAASPRRGIQRCLPAGAATAQCQRRGAFRSVRRGDVEQEGAAHRLSMKGAAQRLERRRLREVRRFAAERRVQLVGGISS